MIGRFIQETSILLEQEKYQEVYELCNQELTNYEHLDRNHSEEERFYIATIYSILAQILDNEDALKCLNCAISFVPNSATLYYKRAEVKKSISDYKGAISDYSVVIENAPTSDAYLYRAIAKFSLSDFKGTIADCTKALDINPELIHAYSFRAEARMQLQQFQLALEDFQKVLELDSENEGAKKAIFDMDVSINSKKNI